MPSRPSPESQGATATRWGRFGSLVSAIAQTCAAGRSKAKGGNGCRSRRDTQFNGRKPSKFGSTGQFLSYRNRDPMVSLQTFLIPNSNTTPGPRTVLRQQRLVERPRRLRRRASDGGGPSLRLVSGSDLTRDIRDPVTFYPFRSVCPEAVRFVRRSGRRAHAVRED
jgi:hypothetical protein